MREGGKVNGRARKAMLMCLVSVLHLQACASQPASKPASPKPVRLKVLLLPSLSSAPLFVAADGGYFSEQGLEVEFVKTSRSAEALAALAQGELDVWTGSVSFSLFNAIARKARIKVVSDKGTIALSGCSYGALMVRRALIENKELSSPVQLRGRRIVLNPSASPGYFMEKLLKPVGLTLDDIKVVDIPDGALVGEALKNGSVDAAFVLEPWVTQILQAGNAVIFAPAEQVVPNYQHLVTVYGPSLLDENPEAGKKFMAAYLKAVRQYNQGKTERNLEILARGTGLDKELLRKACWPSVRGDGQIDLSSLIDFQNWGMKRQFLDRVLTSDQVWDPTFVDYARQMLR
jgi:NitT/TauT family transport system substrate-binding protein